MPYRQRKGGQKWREKTKTDSSGLNRLGEWSASGSSGQTRASVQPIQFGRVQVNPVPVQGKKGVWLPKSYGTVGGSTAVEAEVPAAAKSTVGLQQNGKSSSGASKVFKGNLLENFTVDNSTYSQVQIRATFYPKFENEKSDLEIRTRMIEMVSNSLASLEVSLKHSGSLFMYAGNEGGAYAKNSFDIQPLVYLSLDACFVRHGDLKQQKSKQSSMIS
ncbi:tRNA ligase 1-like [Argentina anserina]|uniref:tRNA ligase 1-like n=1 Tax=Argentina anserina TaxID=57926 RepID=UPI0021762011|nr:tRNA ligase 1-like [Potentilla anserina]